MSLKAEEWDLSYRNKDNFVFYPHEEIIRFSAKYIAKRVGLDEVSYRTNQENKILDLGCGIGRHLIFFEKLGMETFGIDLSKEAITVAREWLKKENINPENKLVSGTAENLPWNQDEFNFIVSHGVLDSMPFDIAKNVVRECHRVIRNDGLFYCDLIGDESEYGNNFEGEVLVESNHENGTIQSYFSLDKIQDLFKNLFEIKELNKVINQNVFTKQYYTRFHLVLKKVDIGESQ